MNIPFNNPLPSDAEGSLFVACFSTLILALTLCSLCPLPRPFYAQPGVILVVVHFVSIMDLKVTGVLL